MKIIVTKENLANALRKVASGIGSRAVVPILNNVFFHAEGDRVTIKAGDSEIVISTWISALIEEEGETTLPFKILQQIVAAFPLGDVTIDSDSEDNSKITCCGSIFTIHGLSSVDYPKDNDMPFDWSFQMKSADLIKGVNMVVYAKSVDSQRHQLNGVVMSIRSGMITFAATDGRRLALFENTQDDTNAKEGDYILPSRASSTLSKCLMDGGDMVTISMNASCVSFETLNTTLITKLVEGAYPNFRQVIPDNCGNSVTVNRNNLISVLSRTSLVLKDGDPVKLIFSDDKLTVNAVNAETGTSEEVIEIAYQGEEVTISFNPGFFLEPLKNMEVDNVTLEFGKQYTPIKLMGDEGFLYMVMPMRG